jgi:uncharacterized membrane protein YjjB (DUF3815 family)
MIIQTIAAFFATIFFSILFNVNKTQLFLCGFVGASGWFTYLLSLSFGINTVVSSFLASFIVSIFSTILAINRKNPVTIYQIPGIIPIVPGAGMYKALFYLINDELYVASEYLVETIQIAATIALAMLTVYSIRQLLDKIKIYKYKNAKINTK